MTRRSEAPSRTPVSLINRLRGGTDDEWRAFHGIYAPVIYRLCQRARLRVHDADEVTSEVMAALHRNIEKGYAVDHDLGRFRDYLATLTQRAIATCYRAAGRRERRKGDARAGAGLRPRITPAPAEELARIEAQELLQACLNELRHELRARDWQAFESYALLEEPARAVAKRYGMTMAKLYQLKSRTLQRIRDWLRAHGLDP